MVNEPRRIARRRALAAPSRRSTGSNATWPRCEQRVIEQLQMLRAQMEPWDLLIQQTLAAGRRVTRQSRARCSINRRCGWASTSKSVYAKSSLSGLHLLVRQLLARVTSAQDQLKSLRKDLNELTAAFDATPASADAGALSGPDGGRPRRRERLHPASADEADRTIRSPIFANAT